MAPELARHAFGLGAAEWPAFMLVDRHRHRAPYAAVILDGGYEEAGDEGRRKVRAGDVLIHPAFGAHLDRMGSRGARTLNLPLPGDGFGLPLRGRTHDPDALARLAARDARAAADLLLEDLRPCPDDPADWPDDLAADLREDPGLCLGRWAASRGLRPETVSRGFHQVFGLTAARFRADARARKAWRAVVEAEAPLAAVAVDAGFADQAHMTRALRALTGRSPGAWRRSPGTPLAA